MKCGGDITIYGLFPETDTPVDEVDNSGCDWAVYPRPECVGAYVRGPDALWIKNSDIRIPIESLIDPGQPFNIKFKYYNKQEAFSITWIESLEYALSGPDTTKDFTSEYSSRDYSQQIYSRITINNHVDPTAGIVYTDNGTHQWMEIDHRFDITAGTLETYSEHLGIDNSPRLIGPSPAPTVSKVQGYVPEDWILGGSYLTNNTSQFADVEIWQGTTQIAYWPMDEGAGEILYDRSGNDNHILIEDFGECLWDTKVYQRNKKALRFDGLATYIEIPWEDVPLSDSIGLGVSMVVTADSDTTYPLVAKEGTVLTDPDHLLFSVTFVLAGQGTSLLEAASSSYSGAFTSTSPNCWANKKNYITLLKAGSSGVQTIAYQYPEPSTTTFSGAITHTIGATDWANLISTGKLLIGTNNDKSAFFSGVIRDIMLWPLVSGDPYYTGNPIAWYALDDETGDGGVITDRSGNGYDGILHLGAGSWVTAT